MKSWRCKPRTFRPMRPARTALAHSQFDFEIHALRVTRKCFNEFHGAQIKRHC